MTTSLNLPDKQDWTVDDLASLSADLRYELIDGRLILQSPTALHQDICVQILLALRANCSPALLPVVHLSLEIDRRNELRPDVVVIRPDHPDITPLPVADALLAIDVISPGWHFRDMYAKAKVYAAAGVPSYWVIDPLFLDGIVLTEFRIAADGEYEIVSSTNKVFTTDAPYPVTIDMSALTARQQELLDDIRPTS